jgi:xylose isomerase
MDAFARGLKVAARLIKDKALSGFVSKRYRGWDKGLGRKIERGRMSFSQLEAYALKNGEPKVQSGRQEMLENVLNEYL